MFFRNQVGKVYTLVDEHFDDVSRCFDAYEAFMEEYLNTPQSQRCHDLYATVDNLERDADVARRTLIREVGNTIIPGNTKTEIMSLVQMIDGVANICQDAARLIILERVVLPEAYRDDVRRIVAITRDQLNLLDEASSDLFNDYSSLEVEGGILGKIKRKESDVDEIELSLIKTLFESDMSLAEKLFYRNFLSRVCDISDLIENIADQIQIMVVSRKS